MQLFLDAIMSPLSILLPHPRPLENRHGARSDGPDELHVLVEDSAAVLASCIAEPNFGPARPSMEWMLLNHIASIITSHLASPHSGCKACLTQAQNCDLRCHCQSEILPCDRARAQPAVGNGYFPIASPRTKLFLRRHTAGTRNQVADSKESMLFAPELPGCNAV